MSLFWLIALMVASMIPGIPLISLLWLIAKMYVNAHRLFAYTRMDELDAIKILTSSKSGFFDLAMPLAWKLAEIALLFNYEALRLLKQLEDTQAVSHKFACECKEAYQENILYIKTNSSQNELAIPMTQYKFELNLMPPEKISPDAASALDAWHKFTQKQEKFKRMMRIYESTFRLNMTVKNR